MLRTTLDAVSVRSATSNDLGVALVHVVDPDPVARQLLSQWLEAHGVLSQCHAHLGEFLQGYRPDQPGCLVIDAQPQAISGVEPQAILLPLTLRCPIVVVRKPLLEPEIVAAVVAAIAVDAQQRAVEFHRAELRTRFSLLSRRERQVMALVTRGLLNKQVGCDLGISEITIKAHRGSAMRKLGARSLAELVRMSDALAEEVDAELASIRNENSTPVRSVAAVGRHSGYIPGHR